MGGVRGEPPCLPPLGFLLNPVIIIGSLQRLLRWPRLSHKPRIIPSTGPPTTTEELKSLRGPLSLRGGGESNLAPIQVLFPFSGQWMKKTLISGDEFALRCGKGENQWSAVALGKVVRACVCVCVTKRQ